MDRPGVGVGVIVKKDDQILLLKRRGAHGEGTWSLPGGKLDMYEQIEDCAVRETMEETGIAIKDLKVIGFTNDPMEMYGKHYITIYVESVLANGEVRIMEPEKCSQIGWFSIDNLPEPLFEPFKNLVENRQYPRRNI